MKFFSSIACVVVLMQLLLFCPKPAQAAFLSYVGVDFPWISYGNGFGSSYNATTADGYLNEIRYTYHCNFVRIWCCEGLDGLIMSGDNCTGFSSTNSSHIADFVGRANGKGMKVDCVFINYMDVQSHPNMIANQTYANNLVWNGFINLVRALSGKDCWFDLVNEGNLSTSAVSWTSLRWFCNTAVNAEHNQGFTQWITMSDQNATDYTNYLSTTVGGLGFNFYDYHSYNDKGTLAVSKSTVGGQPIMLSEYGPANPWKTRTDAANQTTINNFINNASNQGYIGAAAWCYIPDGSNWEMRGTNAMWNVEYWGALFGY